MAQALHAAERAWLVEQGWADHPFKASKDHSQFAHCTICDRRKDRGLTFRTDRHSPLMVEYRDLPEPERGRYRALAAVQGGAVAQSADVYIPGEWSCPKCVFTLQKNNLHAYSMTVSANTDTAREVCPNDGATLVRVTWEERAKEAQALYLEEVKRSEYQREQRNMRHGAWLEEKARADTAEMELKEIRARAGESEAVVQAAREFTSWLRDREDQARRGADRGMIADGIHLGVKEALDHADALTAALEKK